MRPDLRLQLYNDPRRTLRRNWPWLIPAAVPLAVDAVLLAVFGPRLPPGSEAWWIVFFLDFLLFFVAIAFYADQARRAQARANRALQANAYLHP